MPFKITMILIVAPILAHVIWGPLFAGANAAIKKWCEVASILKTLSAAFNPEGNGEAERAVQATKRRFLMLAMT